MAVNANLYAARAGARSLHSDAIQCITDDVATVADALGVTSTAHGFNLAAREGDVFVLTATSGNLRWFTGTTEAAAESAASQSTGPVLMDGMTREIRMGEGRYLAIIEATFV